MGQVRDAEVRLTIPPEARFLRLARLAVSGIAADLGFTLAAIEDLRVAVDELAALVIDGASAPLEICYRVEGDHLRIDGACAHTAPIEVDEMAREILAMTADDYRVDSTAGGRTFELTVAVPRG